MLRFWLTVLFSFVVGLSVWAVISAMEIQHRIAIFAIVGVILTAITSVLTIVTNNSEAKARDTALLIRKEQQRVFDHFYNAFFQHIKNTKSPSGKQGEKEAIDETYQFRQGLMCWGSESLIAGYLEYERDLAASVGAGLPAMIGVGDKFINLMRAELGFQDSGKVSIMSVILDAEARNELERQKRPSA